SAPPLGASFGTIGRGPDGTRLRLAYGLFGLRAWTRLAIRPAAPAATSRSASAPRMINGSGTDDALDGFASWATPESPPGVVLPAPPAVVVVVFPSSPPWPDVSFVVVAEPPGGGTSEFALTVPPPARIFASALCRARWMSSCALEYVWT